MHERKHTIGHVGIKRPLGQAIRFQILRRRLDTQTLTPNVTPSSIFTSVTLKRAIQKNPGNPFPPANYTVPTYLGKRRPFRTVVHDNLERPRLHEARELALPLFDGNRGADHERSSPRLARFVLHLLLHSRPPLRHPLVFEVRAVRHNGADSLFEYRFDGGTIKVGEG